MALIKCTECENQISDKAVACPKCGNPIASVEEITAPPQKAEGTLVVYGYTGWFLVKPKMKIYINGEYIGDVSHKAKTREIPITKPTEVTIKSSIRSTSIRGILPGKRNEIYTEFDSVSGNIMAELRSY